MSEDEARAIGAQIRRYRQRRGMKQKHLAAEAGCSISAISRIERGERQSSALAQRLLEIVSSQPARSDQPVAAHATEAFAALFRVRRLSNPARRRQVLRSLLQFAQADGVALVIGPGVQRSELELLRCFKARLVLNLAPDGPQVRARWAELGAASGDSAEAAPVVARTPGDLSAYPPRLCWVDAAALGPGALAHTDIAGSIYGAALRRHPLVRALVARLSAMPVVYVGCFGTPAAMRLLAVLESEVYATLGRSRSTPGCAPGLLVAQDGLSPTEDRAWSERGLTVFSAERSLFNTVRRLRDIVLFVQWTVARKPSADLLQLGDDAIRTELDRAEHAYVSHRYAESLTSARLALAALVIGGDLPAIGEEIEIVDVRTDELRPIVHYLKDGRVAARLVRARIRLALAHLKLYNPEREDGHLQWTSCNLEAAERITEALATFIRLQPERVSTADLEDCRASVSLLRCRLKYRKGETEAARRLYRQVTKGRRLTHLPLNRFRLIEAVAHCRVQLARVDYQLPVAEHAGDLRSLEETVRRSRVRSAERLGEWATESDHTLETLSDDYRARRTRALTHPSDEALAYQLKSLTTIGFANGSMRGRHLVGAAVLGLIPRRAEAHSAETAARLAAACRVLQIPAVSRDNPLWEEGYRPSARWICLRARYAVRSEALLWAIARMRGDGDDDVDERLMRAERMMQSSFGATLGLTEVGVEGITNRIEAARLKLIVAFTQTRLGAPNDAARVAAWAYLDAALGRIAVLEERSEGHKGQALWLKTMAYGIACYLCLFDDRAGRPPPSGTELRTLDRFSSQSQDEQLWRFARSGHRRRVDTVKALYEEYGQLADAPDAALIRGRLFEGVIEEIKRECAL